MTESTTTMSASVGEKLGVEDINGKERSRSGVGGGIGNGSNGDGEIFYSYNGKQNVTLSSSTQSPLQTQSQPQPQPQLQSQPQSHSSSGEVSGADNSSSTSSTSSPNSVVLNMKQNGSSPVCKNCLTVTTPLWRRDENGAVLCNACGLFLKLHGRPRPISLKTDVIKSRNRKGTHNHHSNDSNPHGANQLTSPRIVEGHKRSQSEEKKRRKINTEKSGTTGFEASNPNGSASGSGNGNGNNNGPANNGLRMKRAKINDSNQLTSSESKDIRSAATTLEILMSSDSSKPKLKPKVNGASSVAKPETSSAALSPSPSQSHLATQLPHLSSLLGEVNQNQTQTQSQNQSQKHPAPPSNPATNGTTNLNTNPSAVEDRFGSPNIVPQNTTMSKQASYHVTSINDVLNENSNNSSNVNNKALSGTAPNGFGSIAVTAGSSTTSLVREPSMSQHYASPPPAIPTQLASTLPIPMYAHPQQHHQQQQQPNNDKQNGISIRNEHAENPLNVTLQNEEEVIKLKTRISELELVTDLYKRHIFELDERCRSLQVEIQTLKH